MYKTYYSLDAQGNTLSAYTTVVGAAFTQESVTLYGSARLGEYRPHEQDQQAPERAKSLPVIADGFLSSSGGVGGGFFRKRGYVHYELTNHLGNVLATITDRKLPSFGGAGGGSFYLADIVSLQDYYAFGMTIPERTYNADAYRYTINGQEKDTDIDASGNHTTALYWEYDSRVGRRWNIDPVVKESISSYATFDNNPIELSDVLGNTTESTGVRDNKDGTYTIVGAKKDDDNNVYIVDGNNQWTKESKVIAKTLTPYDFMYTHDSDGTFTNDPNFGKSGEVTFCLENLKFDAVVKPDKNSEYTIYNVDLDRLKTCGAEILDRAAPPEQNSNIDRALVLAIYSRNNKCLDFKSSFKLNKYTPISVSEGKGKDVPVITSLRAASNIVFGANLAHTNSHSIVSAKSYYCFTMLLVGEYNQYQNTGSGYNSGYPYYGEHTYSGSFIYFGYFGTFYK